VSHPSYQKFTDLSLSIPMDRSTKHISLEDCLKDFTSSETVHDVDCSGWIESPITSQNTGMQCKKMNNRSKLARKKLSIARAPTILCLHIRRLVHTEFGFGKLSCHIKFPQQFDLAPYCSFDLSECVVTEETATKLNPPRNVNPCSSLWSDLSKYKNTNPSTGMLNSCIGGDNSYVPKTKVGCECTQLEHEITPPMKPVATSQTFQKCTSPLLYSLVSVVEHSGNHAGGHYTAYRKGQKQQWYHISDERVIPLEDIRNASAYMLFYERIP